MARRLPLIAVVDDEESVRKSLRRLLAASHMDAVVFASGQEFLDSLRLRHPDCLVLDLQMPGLTGLDVQRILTEASVRFPTIIITAHDEPETRARCLSAGAASYLCKPLHDEMLLDTIADAIDRR
ncbi:MAG: response regulator transcription factor [Candidatus Rokuibacteriota bacterium]